MYIILYNREKDAQSTSYHRPQRKKYHTKAYGERENCDDDLQEEKSSALWRQGQIGKNRQGIHLREGIASSVHRKRGGG